MLYFRGDKPLVLLDYLRKPGEPQETPTREEPNDPQSHKATDTTEHPLRGDMGTRKLAVKETPGTPPERPPLTRKSKNELTKVLEKGNHPCNPREGTQ